MGDIHLDDNSQDYRPGNSVNGSIWTAYRVNDSLSSAPAVAGRSEAGRAVPFSPIPHRTRQGGATLLEASRITSEARVKTTLAEN